MMLLLLSELLSPLYLFARLIQDWRRPWRLPKYLLHWLFSWFLALPAGYSGDVSASTSC
jgi:hypothetical protein